MISYELVQKIWQMLEKPQRGNQLDARELDMIQLPSGHPLLTIDVEGHRHLLIPISDPNGLEDRQSAGVHIRNDTWGYESEQHRYVDVVCLKPHLNGIFDLMLLDILGTLSEESGRPDRVCRAVLNRWREFLIPEPSHLPEKSKIVGVWGELWVLSQLCDRNPDAIKLWTGPNGGRFDFYGSSKTLEVKTTLQRRGTTITISSVDQLDSPAEIPLSLAVLKLEETPAGDLSIPDLIDEIVDKGVERRLLLTLLLKIGFTPEVLNEIVDFRFTLVDWLMYEINDQFPKVVPSSFKGDALPNGVLSLVYQIDLSAKPPYPLDDTAKVQFINQFAEEI